MVVWEGVGGQYRRLLWGTGYFSCKSMIYKGKPVPTCILGGTGVVGILVNSIKCCQMGKF